MHTYYKFTHKSLMMLFFVPNNLVLSARFSYDTFSRRGHSRNLPSDPDLTQMHWHTKKSRELSNN